MTEPIAAQRSMKGLPFYKDPPVVEVVCGMRFPAPDKLRIPHIGLLWLKFRKDYPIVQHVPPIPDARGEMLIDKATGLPPHRIWFINEADDQIIQFQFDRFYFNWRRRENDYPRFSTIFKSFCELQGAINDFFEENALGRLKPTEYELTYINHIPQGRGWQTMRDLAKIIPDFAWRDEKKRFLPYPDSGAWRIMFSLPQNAGRLDVALNRATRSEDGLPLLVLELTARGFWEARDGWFRLAHEWIVRGFADLTSMEIQKSVWGRQDDLSTENE